MQDTKTKTCRKCGGSGKVRRGDKTVTCQACRGSGKSSDYQTK